ncbi:ABC transporter substrate-binding protein [Rhodovibrio sodomensis]|nr:ABC transporter substrate-binding protein [Rhodovibrio sodomensis]
MTGIPQARVSMRRRLRTVAVALAAVLLLVPPARAGDPPRVAAITWDLTETLMALGVAPVAVANLRGYREWVVAPELPADTVDIGLRFAPSLTTLAASDPDLILTSRFLRDLPERLKPIAPVEALTIYPADGDPLARAIEVTRTLANRLDRRDAFADVTARLERQIRHLAAKVADRERPDQVYLVQFQDADHVRVYAQGSLFQSVFDRAGIENAWDGATNGWGFALIPLAQLTASADHLIVLEPVPTAAAGVLDGSPIWQALPAVRSGQVHRLPAVWGAGGVLSAIRFARLLARHVYDRR